MNTLEKMFEGKSLCVEIRGTKAMTEKSGGVLGIGSQYHQSFTECHVQISLQDRILVSFLSDVHPGTLTKEIIRQFERIFNDESDPARTV